MERALRTLGVRPVRPVGTAQRLARVVGGGLCVLALAGATWAQGAVPKDTLPASFSRSVPLGLPTSLTERWGSDEEAQLGRRLFFAAPLTTGAAFTARPAGRCAALLTTAERPCEPAGPLAFAAAEVVFQLLGHLLEGEP